MCYQLRIHLRLKNLSYSVDLNGTNKTKYTMELGIYFLMKTNKQNIVIKIGLIRTYFLINPLIFWCENLKSNQCLIP